MATGKVGYNWSRHLEIIKNVYVIYKVYRPQNGVASNNAGPHS
jgi:hypothetical protein